VAAALEGVLAPLGGVREYAVAQTTFGGAASRRSERVLAPKTRRAWGGLVLFGWVVALGLGGPDGGGAFGEEGGEGGFVEDLDA
jgi:hypothetical protein